MTESLLVRIEGIETWDHSCCQNAWIAMTGIAPGSRLSLRFLCKALIFELQCKELDGHSVAIRRQLRAGTKSTPASAQALTPDMQLVREQAS